MSLFSGKNTVLGIPLKGNALGYLLFIYFVLNSPVALDEAPPLLSTATTFQ